MQTSESIATIAKALSAFQGEAPNPAKTKTAKVPTKSGGEYRYNYADLSDIITAIRPLLAKHGLAVSQSPFFTPEGVGVETLLTHASGEWFRSAPLPMPLSGATAQAAGSAITYSRRYALSAMLGISTEEDDDGGLATSHQTSQPPQVNTAKATAPASPSDYQLPSTPPTAPTNLPGYDQQTKITFGKYRGKSLAEADTGYLNWLHNSLEAKLDDPEYGASNQRLYGSVGVELKRREDAAAQAAMGTEVDDGIPFDEGV